jgi:hypothetical protein
VAWIATPTGRAAGGDPILGQALDRLGHQLDIGALQRRIVVVGNEHATAADGIVRREELALARIGDLTRQMFQRYRLGHPADAGFPGQNRQNGRERQ